MRESVESSIYGVFRGIAVHSCIFPLEVVKLRQQIQNKKSYQVAVNLFKEEGFLGFYKGLTPQLCKTSIKQAWCWPMIIQLPKFLEKSRLHPLAQQTITGLSIASVDALFSAPLDKWKVQKALGEKPTFSWRGFSIHCAKLSVNWTTFLVAQHILRERYSKGQELSWKHYVTMGTQVALLVSVVSAPFDFANTYKQGRDINVFSKVRLYQMYRGLPLSALSLVIQNVASVTLIEYLSKRKM